MHYRHNLELLPEKTDEDAYFKSKCRQMFVSGKVSKFGPWGGQKAVAELIGVDQSTVSRGSQKVTSPYRANLKRKRRDDAFEKTHPEQVAITSSFWVRLKSFSITLFVQGNPVPVHVPVLNNAFESC